MTRILIIFDHLPNSQVKFSNSSDMTPFISQALQTSRKEVRDDPLLMASLEGTGCVAAQRTRTQKSNLAVSLLYVSGAAKALESNIKIV